MTGRPLMNQKKAAEYLGLSLRQLRSIIYRREIAFIKASDARNSAVLIDPDDADAWKRAHRVPAGSAS